MSEQANVRRSLAPTRMVPVSLAVLAAVVGLMVPREDSLYLAGHFVALILALAVPLSYGWLNRGPRPRARSLHLFLLIGLSIFGTVSALMSGVLLSFGSADGAAGDIGEMFLWLLSTVGLFVLSIAAAVVWPRAISDARGVRP
ncbi:hypothetical protein [Arthrobacter sp. PAMC 25486]|uniref:hypothetical protein n=1 Tax=Arthrobacter sp. PAMC 25486 TaxID=1494608 RepID=UPI0012FEF111|nr:hypothetical protein [Arthrobacter sp. PAMC 25486]